jgi:hypothetical protein
VCGQPQLDLDLLRSNTLYLYGLDPGATHIVNFWQILEEFTPEEQSMFLRFVWGRSRLPDAFEFDTKFKLLPWTPSGQDHPVYTFVNNAERNKYDEYLPLARTCFFSLSLPPYTTKPKMREKLLYAITTCKEFNDNTEDYVVDSFSGANNVS